MDADDRDRVLRRRLAEFAKEHHPDRGGDPAFYVEGVRRIEQALARAAAFGRSGKQGRRAGLEVRFVTGRQRRRRVLVRRGRRLRRRLASQRSFTFLRALPLHLRRTLCR